MLKRTIPFLTLAFVGPTLTASELPSADTVFELQKSVNQQKSAIVSLKKELSDLNENQSQVIENLEAEAAKQLLVIDHLTADSTTYTNSDSDASCSPCFPCTPSIFCYRNNPCCKGGYLESEFIYWRTIQDNSDYALSGQTLDPLESNGMVGDLKNTRFDWDLGFRIKLGYQFDVDPWGIEGGFTYFRNRGSSKTFGNSEVGLTNLVGTFSQEFPFGFSDVATTVASSNIGLTAQLFDLLVFKKLVLENSLIVKLFSGFSAGSLSEDWNIVYRSPAIATKVINDWDFNGYGLKGGVETDWHIGRGLSISSLFALSTLVGTYENTRAIKTYEFVDDLDTIIVADAHLKDNRAAYNFQIFMGPSYGVAFDTWDFLMTLGYEINGWFNLHEIMKTEVANFSNTRSSRFIDGIVAMQGVTANLTFNF